MSAEKQPRANHIVWMEAVTDDDYLIGRLLGVMDSAARATLYKGNEDVRMIEQLPRNPATHRARLEKVTRMLISRMARTSYRVEHEEIWAAINARITEWPKGPLTDERTALICAGMHHQSAALASHRTAAAKLDYEEALQAAKDHAKLLIEEYGVSEADAARTVGLHRMTVRSAQGKK